MTSTAVTLSTDLLSRWNSDGWFVLESFLPRDVVDLGKNELQRSYFPDRSSVWREPDPVQRSEQFVGITDFPFRTPILNELVAHEQIAGLAEVLLDARDIVLYQAHAWAKYAGAADYGQLLHRDFRNHTLTAPDNSRPKYRQVEVMLYLSDVADDCGPTHLVSRRHTGTVPLNPEFIPREGNEELYAQEKSAAAAAGSLLVYSPDVVHRGTNLVRPGGSRFVVAMGYQRAGNSWMGYHSWPKVGNYPRFVKFVESATPRQLELLGFPRSSDPFWTDETRQAVQERYPQASFDNFFGQESLGR